MPRESTTFEIKKKNQRMEQSKLQAKHMNNNRIQKTQVKIILP
jgi:hypothetical protein